MYDQKINLNGGAMITGLIAAFVFWYLFYGFECALNGASFGRHRTIDQLMMPFECFWEETLWNIPGGFKRKVLYVKENVIGDWKHGVVCGNTRQWEHAEVRKNNLYEACARDVMGKARYFWLKTILLSGIGFCIGYGIQYAIKRIFFH